MMSEKILIDRAASAVTVLNIMPEADAGFADFPAEVDFPVAVERGEVDEPHVDILELAAKLLNILDGGFQSPPGSVFARAELEYAFFWGNHAAQKRDAMRDVSEFRLGLFVRLFLLLHIAHQSFNFR